MIYKYLSFLKLSLEKCSYALSSDFFCAFPVFSVNRLLKEALEFVKHSHFFQMKQLTDMWGADYPSDKLRFQINYYLLTLRYNFRLVFRAAVSYAYAFLPSVSDVFPSASWLEREIYDLYGIFFQGHPDLRRILTDYGFQGHPLRKDFPLSGYTQLRYDEELKQIVSEPVNFSQEYRYFDFLSPWR